MGSLLADLVNHGFKYDNDLSKQKLNILSHCSNTHKKSFCASTIQHSLTPSSTTESISTEDNPLKRQRTDSLCSVSSSENELRKGLSPFNLQLTVRGAKPISAPSPSIRSTHISPLTLPTGPSAPMNRPMMNVPYLSPAPPPSESDLFSSHQKVYKQCGILKPLPIQLRELFYLHVSDRLAEFLLDYLERFETSIDLKKLKKKMKEIRAGPGIPNHKSSMPRNVNSNGSSGGSIIKPRTSRLATNGPVKTTRFNSPPVNGQESRQRYEQSFKSLNT
ncbi:unnamed protein product [Ambrosiozyma monospora]|uniref:Unnamed protein product n=1 Tax=Ambrosiozyma monospora TaxID=43982 RepID=A0ACB5U021_AMBMO|nr:unnamed protein product [Ambrosiozyma monospora]